MTYELVPDLADFLTGRALTFTDLPGVVLAGILGLDMISIELDTSAHARGLFNFDGERH